MAGLVKRVRVQINDSAFYEVKIWKVPKSDFFKEGIKYSMAIIENGIRIIGYDNERAKGHHKHIAKKETVYNYMDIEKLLDDFEKDVENYRKVKK